MQRRTEVLLFRWLKPHHFIILLEVLAFAALITTYGIAVGTKQVPPVWPYISAAGAVPPASCIFALLFSLSAVCGAVVMNIRHSRLEHLNNEWDAITIVVPLFYKVIIQIH